MDGHQAWKGGRYVHNGYVYLHCIGHPHSIKTTMKTGGYVCEHRLVLERVLGRYLLPTEAVHHVNGVKDDNRPENLELVTKGAHLGHITCPSCHFHFAIR